MRRVACLSTLSSVVRSSLLGAFNVGIGEEGSLRPKSGIQVEEHCRGRARNGLILVLAGEAGLVEHSLLTADERMLLLQVTAVEDLATIK